MPARTDRLDALQAAILSVKLGRLDGANERRRDAGARAARGACRGPGASPLARRPPTATTSSTSSWCALTVREALREHLDAEGISCAIHYPTPIHLQPAYADRGLWAPAACQSRSGWRREICSLPVFPTIEPRQIERIAAAVAGFDPGLSRATAGSASSCGGTR